MAGCLGEKGKSAAKEEREDKAEYIKALEAVRRAALLWVWHCESMQKTLALVEFHEALGMVDKARERYWDALEKR